MLSKNIKSLIALDNQGIATQLPIDKEYLLIKKENYDTLLKLSRINLANQHNEEFLSVEELKFDEWYLTVFLLCSIIV